MIEALGYVWLRPYWLALIPLAAILGAILAKRADRLGAWESAVDPELLAAMRKMGRVLPLSGRQNLWPSLAVAALGLALAGPATEHRDTTSYRNLDGVVLVIDLSPSVSESGQLFEALTAARIVAKAAGTRQTAAIAYAGEAYTIAPFSTDTRALDGALALIDPDVMPIGGSRAAEGLKLARHMLEEAQILISDVVLISDGGGLGPAAFDEAAALVSAGAALSVLEVPGDAAGVTTLAALARAGNGRIATHADPYPVADHISLRPAERLAETDYAILVLEDIGRYLLIIALFPAFLLLPRRSRA